MYLYFLFPYKPTILTNKPINKKENPFEFSLLWCHQGLMYPCKHLYLNALPLASIKKPRDWHV